MSLSPIRYTEVATAPPSTTNRKCRSVAGEVDPTLGDSAGSDTKKGKRHHLQAAGTVSPPK